MPDAILHTKYRPKDFSQVIGQDAVTRSLRAVLKKDSSHAFLFSGPAGVGKTTLARLAAAHIGCEVLEIDGATYTGIDDMREIKKAIQYRPLDAVDKKAIIVDEAHRLSTQAWDSNLKVIEEPPPWVYWFFCTTEPARIKPTIVSRCTHYPLKPIEKTALVYLLESVVVAEELFDGAADLAHDIVRLCASEANGSARQALVNLAACASAKNKGQATRLLRSAEGSVEARDLARHLLSRDRNWAKVQSLLQSMKEQDQNAESVRHVVRGYATAAVLGAKNDRQAARAFRVLDAFSEPFPYTDGLSPVVLAVGRLIFAA